MKYIYRLIFIIYIINRLVANSQVGVPQLTILLVLISSYIFRLKYKNLKSLIYAEIVVIFFASVYLADLTPLFALSVYDFIDLKIYPASVFPVALTIFFIHRYDLSVSFVLLAISAIFGYMLGKLKEKERLYKDMFDREREYSYELERSRNVLKNSAKDAARIAEIKERNRIAREIHDNIGHSIAGVLMQLRASSKLIEKGDSKGKELLDNSIGVLSESLELIRNTVHNIKPSVNMGIEYIKEIIDNFKFCEIDFEHRGDISKLSPDIMEAIVTSLKEVLTNASKYSEATKIDVKLEYNPKFIRLYVKDNGCGCKLIKEGMGLGGIKERIANIGGSVAISGDNGFTVVCLIPVEEGSF